MVCSLFFVYEIWDTSPFGRQADSKIEDPNLINKTVRKTTHKKINNLLITYRTPVNSAICCYDSLCQQ